MDFDPLDQYCRRGAYQEALSLLAPDHPARGEILYWSGHPEARAVLQAQVGPTARLAEALCCWQADLYDEGLDLLDALPDGSEANVTRALILLCQGQLDTAECPAGLSDHRQFRAWHDLAVSYEFLGKLELAADYYQRAAVGWRNISAEHPELANALFGLTGVQQKLGHSRLRYSAQEFLQIIGSDDPRWPAMAEALALVELEEQEWQALEPLLEQLWQRAPRASIAYMLAITQSALDKPAAALVSMKEARAGFQAEGLPDRVERCQRNIDKLIRELG